VSVSMTRTVRPEDCAELVAFSDVPGNPEYGGSNAESSVEFLHRRLTQRDLPCLYG